MPTRTEAIKLFLTAKTHPDLAELYSGAMECQVNVAQDDGQRVEDTYKGKAWHGWTNGQETWKTFRIPYKANSEPEYTDIPMSFSLDQHAEGIGMTGWDWKERVSRWVAFDFDALIGHSERHTRKMTPEEIDSVRERVSQVPWVTVRKSTGGRGLHLYVFIEKPEPTLNHHEHAALARAILGKISGIIGVNLESKVDTCGGNMWVWHRKMQQSDGQGLSLLKLGTKLTEAPLQWRDHINVVTRKKPRNLPKLVEAVQDDFTELVSQRGSIQLDDEHRKLIQHLEETKAHWWWDQDASMLVAHTYDLKVAHETLKMRGKFETLSKGTERGQDQNCFAFPLKNGAWVVRRHTPGVEEASTWEQDLKGWTRCWLNREPDLRTASKTQGGVEIPKGGYAFPNAQQALNALSMLGTKTELPAWLVNRPAKLKRHRDGRIVMEVDHIPSDPNVEGWLAEKKVLTRLFNGADENAEPEGNYDDLVRHVVDHSMEDAGWYLNTTGSAWTMEPLTHVTAGLRACGYNPKDVQQIVGASVLKPWTLVNKPFQPEFPGNREWNRNSARLRYTELVEEEPHPYWDRILQHCGSGLDNTVRENGWCKQNGILTGADYLKVWVASMLQEPTEPLPYLFFYGEQDSGKSIFHEALQYLFVRGCGRADKALTSEFNAELEGMVLCVIEETDINGNKTAYNRIKDWVTSKDILIHRKGQTPYVTVNTAHFVQCANDFSACPIFPGDTRITMLYVKSLDPDKVIPKKVLMPLLEKEAQAFLSSVLRLELPAPISRLNIPVLVTDDKRATEQLNENDLECFLRECVFETCGYSVKLDEFADRFHAWLPPDKKRVWSKQRISRMLPPKYPKGKLYDPMTQTTALHYGNMWFEKLESTKTKLVAVEGYLVPER